jgi:alkylation response protein AidB-like acyl-CoA dehydrogenase
MNLEFSDDQKFVQKTARDYLTENAPLSLCRAVLEGNKPYDPALWKGVAEMGWLGTAVPEAYGGAGLSHLELVLIAQELGRTLAPIPFSSSVYLAIEAILQAGSEAQKQKWLPKLTSGEAIGTLALAEGLGDFDASSASGTRFDGSRVTGVKVPVSDGSAANVAVVVAREGNGHSLVLVELDGEGVSRTALASFDASRPLARLQLEGARGERLGAVGQGAGVVRDVLDRAAVLMGYEQIGGAERALELTRSFTMGRFAFGRPVASFQALKHRMADVYAKTQIALSNGYFAAWSLSNGSDELAVAACSTRVAASEAFVLASEEMIQMHGGVGFTWEYDCHLFYRRARSRAAALGTPNEWRVKLVSRLQASGFGSGKGALELAAE